MNPDSDLPPPVQALAGALTQAAQQLQVDLSEEQTHNLLRYLALIERWNKVYNLTAVRALPAMLTQHLVDSLAVVAPLRRQLQARLCVANGAAGAPDAPVRLLDVGAGAGLPGVVIAICCPDIRVSCVDTVAKKAAFIQQVAVTLKLPNLCGVHARVESLTGPFEVISSRAFASLADFVSGSRAALAEGGVWMAMKGKHPAPELAALAGLSRPVDVFHVEQLAVPGLDAERCIVWMREKPAV